MSDLELCLILNRTSDDFVDSKSDTTYTLCSLLKKIHLTLGAKIMDQMLI